MYTFKPKKLLILFSSCSLLLSACYPSGKQLLSIEDNNVISEQIENIVSNNEHLDIEINASTDENVLELPKINVKVMEWDEDKLKEIFLNGKTNIEYNEFPCDFFSNENYHVYTEEDQYWLLYESGRLAAEERKSVFGYGTMAATLELYRFEDFFNEDSISALPKEEAINRCTDLLRDVGLTNYSEPYVYAITADKANKYWHETNCTEYEKWNADDEVYLLRFPIEYNAVPVTDICSNSREINGHGGYFVGSNIDFIVTKDKVFSLTANNIFSPEYELGENVKINCTFENALKIAAEHYDSINLAGQDIKISDCELVYVPYEQHDEKNFTLIPMWIINASVYEDSRSIMGKRDCLFINAQTGNIIIW